MFLFAPPLRAESLISHAGFKFLKYAKMFADPIKNAIFGYFHEFRLPMDPATDSKMFDIELDEPAKRLRNPQSRVWCFDRECR